LDVEKLAKLVEDMQLDLRPDEVKMAMEMMDDDHDGLISKKEFVDWFIPLQSTFRKTDSRDSGNNGLNNSTEVPTEGGESPQKVAEDHKVVEDQKEVEQKVVEEQKPQEQSTSESSAEEKKEEETTKESTSS
jgi:hypothetical protein